ncbi:Predicted amidohydrolase [Thermoanaerobacter thermohydrosulfuricus]|uniref:Predicted amidohydrolase n=2 Tax=Thermoanaerobacter thermohydrosulfuricus TaxID=1516 RepID=A0A1I2C722_THETY|nr:MULTISPECIES: nitrilase-related carbon-nitrogen hydrolase [Thermoanaerobacter]EMT39871.1 putative amidohydrolase [Thermoanaerobacter thermohydrosulfuricus WC1]SDF55984.1 Predicted amidohydrolase [Thermoanaerobacter thermohydrosulfuricus]SFE64171.1 Predicted amidohydrolase [Thermoanaerobacter thermohydrosulfuricus]
MKNILEIVFESKMSEKKVNNYLRRLHGFSRGNFILKKKGKIRVACVEREIKVTNSFEEYAERMRKFVEEAALKGSDIVAFPEYNFFDLLGLIPGFGKLNNFLNKKAKSEEVSNSEGGGGEGLLKVIFKSISKAYQEAYEKIMRDFAKRYGIYIYTGSYIITENGNLYNGGTLISREGEILGRQKKIHLTDFEEKIGIKGDEELKVFSLDIGKIACPVCMDATYFETFRMAFEKGAEIVILPIANMEEYNFWRALRGIWPRVQESYVYGAKASLNGWIGGIHFTGKAAIFAPIDMTENEDGIIAIAPHYEGDYVVTSDLDIERLYEVREKAEYFKDVNEEFEKDYYEKVYENFRRVKDEK